MFSDGINHRLRSREKVMAQAWALTLVPEKSLINVRRRRGADYELHQSVRLRMRSSRRSSSCCCASAIGTGSRGFERLSQSCSRSSNRSSGLNLAMSIVLMSGLDRTYTDSRRTSAMRVCQPGPVAFQRASVSGGSRRLIAIFESEDFGRPRGLSIAAAVRAPKILGKTSLAGRAFAIIAAVHSGFSRPAFLGLD